VVGAGGLVVGRDDFGASAPDKVLQKEFGFRVVLHHVSDGWKVADEIAAAKVPCSVIMVDSPGGKLEARDLDWKTGAALEKAGANPTREGLLKAIKDTGKFDFGGLTMTFQLMLPLALMVIRLLRRIGSRTVLGGERSNFTECVAAGMVMISITRRTRRTSMRGVVFISPSGLGRSGAATRLTSASSRYDIL